MKIIDKSKKIGLVVKPEKFYGNNGYHVIGAVEGRRVNTYAVNFKNLMRVLKKLFGYENVGGYRLILDSVNK